MSKIKIYLIIQLLTIFACIQKEKPKQIYLSHSFVNNSHGDYEKLSVEFKYADKIKCKESFFIFLPKNFDVIEYKNNIIGGYYKSTCDTFYTIPIEKGYVYVKNGKDSIKINLDVNNIKFNGFVAKNSSPDKW